MGSPIKRLCQIKNTSPEELRDFLQRCMLTSAALPVFSLSPETAFGRLPGQGLRSSIGFGVIASSGLSARPLFHEVCRLRKRKRTSHPSGLRRMERDPLSGPWLTGSPRKSSVPNRVQVIRSQISGSPCVHGPNPGWFTAWALPFPFERLHRRRVGWDSCQSGLVVVNQPHRLVPCPSHP